MDNVSYTVCSSTFVVLEAHKSVSTRTVTFCFVFIHGHASSRLYYFGLPELLVVVLQRFEVSARVLGLVAEGEQRPHLEQQKGTVGLTRRDEQHLMAYELKTFFFTSMLPLGDL